jgi:hypothetical protein
MGRTTIMKPANLVAIVIFLLAVAGCSGSGDTEELLRLPSPDGAFDAVLIRNNGGATTSFVYKVYLIEHGAAPEEGDLTLMTDKSDMPTMAWKDAEKFEIRCNDARIWEFKNFKYFRTGSKNDSWAIINVSLKCGATETGVMTANQWP